MNPIKLIFRLSFILCFVLSACKSANTNEMIIGKWKIKEFTPNPELQIPDSMLNQIKRDLTIEFTNDMKFIQVGAGTEQKGTYSISEDGKKITYSIQGQAETFVDSIVELSESKLLISGQTGNKYTYIR